ncbi:hypothetical protein GQ464_015860 [Rhodocaloribacter litoris]|uniref:hypothetical protein n=1 Tax=Rhodocaloribacter litoris TaxID=2558931 RepID=UPI00141F6839|nr:hypothetical protein [Rhodocaloribacter litoris]QXD14874.1 hypothetical protein GQ464_015860 [Rhodocaloribacter litoris]GIV59030.1 MAG: hypothetical protein KatS3mg043_0119 [Rhodothermaceae bacterium]
MRRLWIVLLMVAVLAGAGCDFFGSDREGGSGDPEGGDGGSDQTLVEQRPGAGT